MTSKQTATLVGLALIWGASFLFIRVLVDADVGAVGVGAGRCTFGLLALIPVVIVTRPRPWPSRGKLAIIAVLGVGNAAIPWSLFAAAEQHVPSTVASVANSTTPLWTAILSAILLRAEGLRRSQQAGLLVGFAGIIALSADGLDGFDSEALAGLGMIAFATFCYGAAAVTVRRWLGGVPAAISTAGQFAVAALVLWPVALATGAYEGASMGLAEWGSLITLGAVGSGFALTAYMALIGQVGAVRASVVTYLIPPTGVLLGWLFLDETVGWNLLAGLGFVVVGVALVQGWAGSRVAALFREPRAAGLEAEAD